jgi:hypothetical protein
MREGNWFRVDGVSCSTVTEAYLGQRTRLECAEVDWILGVHYNKTDASVEESIIAARFGLCTLPFEPVNGATHITEETIRKVFTILEAEQMSERADKCLTAYGRLITFPFYRAKDKTDGGRQGRTTVFETQACNLVPGLMSIPVYTGYVKADWQTLTIEAV